MKAEIVKLEIAEYDKRGSFRDTEGQGDLAERFYKEMLAGVRTTYIYKINGEYAGEISLVTDTGDADYTVPGKRLYVSRLIVKPDHRRQGIGRKLLDFITAKASEKGCGELSVGVDLDNYPALKLYVQAGFDRIICVKEDEYGRFVKLLKVL